MKSEEANEVQTVADELFEDNKELFRDSESEAESAARKRKSFLFKWCKRIRCEYPCYLCCFCINPLGCMKSIQAVLLNWFAIIAALTLISQYYSNSLLALFEENIGIFMFLGIGCFWTAAILFKSMGKIAKLGKNLDESVSKMKHTQEEVIKTLDKLGVAKNRWMDCLEDLHEKNKEIRAVGRKLDKRKFQAEEQRNELSNLFLKYGAKVTGNFQTKREAIDGLIEEQTKTLGEVHENVNALQEEQEDFDERAVRFQEDLEILNETIGEINRPISDLEALKPKLQQMSADPSEYQAFVAGNLQNLVVLERITLLREMSYGRQIFFSVLKNNGGTIDQRLFDKLIVRLPISLREAFWNTTKSYQDYCVVQAKSRLGRTKYGPMDQEKVKEFLEDLETQALEVVQKNIESMPDPSRLVYDEQKDLVAEGEMALDGKENDTSSVLDEEGEDKDDEEGKVVIVG